MRKTGISDMSYGHFRIYHNLSSVFWKPTVACCCICDIYESVTLFNNQITDVTPLAGLINLEVLSLRATCPVIKGLEPIIANIDKARTDYAATGAQREKVLDSLLEDFEKEQIALSEAEGEWTKGKVDQVEKILSGLSGHFELGGAWRKGLDLRRTILDELRKLRAKARNLEAKTALSKNWEAFLVELDGIRRRSSGLPGPIVGGMDLGDLKNTISAGLAKAREGEAKAERKRKRRRLFLFSFIIAAAGFTFYYFSILAPRMQAEEIKVLAERMKENFPVKQPFAVPSSGAEMLWVKPGAFEMGSSSGRFTPYTVTLTEGYWLGKHEVTQAQWEKVMGDNPSAFKGANRAVEQVAWEEVNSFCEKLTELEREAGRLPTGMAYQLPTEAQWEYACRAGTTTAFSFGNSLTSDQANISGGPSETTDAGNYPANGWGFHDMHGNVWEWCADWYGDYPRGSARDPVGPAVGSNRVTRGGSWLGTANSARSAYRSRYGPADSIDYLGFRLSLRPASKAEPLVQVQEKESVAVSVNAGKAFTIQDLGLDMLWVKPGTFEMGSPPQEEDRRDNETQHTVTLTEGYWLGKHPVTQSQWEKVMGSNPSHFKGVNRPVEEVSWTEVTSFCEKLTKLEREAGRLPTGMAYQLPTEAEWEYACRAGTTTAYAFGDSLTSDQANIDGGPDETTDVGKYPANPRGFHDMHGNVWEWCADWYEKSTSRAVSDPVGPAVGSLRVFRGGSWFNSANFARSAYRYGYEPADSNRILGFRLSLRPASK